MQPDELVADVLSRVVGSIGHNTILLVNRGGIRDELAALATRLSASA